MLSKCLHKSLPKQLYGLPKPNQIKSDTLPKLLLIDDLVKQLLKDGGVFCTK